MTVRKVVAIVILPTAGPTSQTHRRFST